MQRPLRKESCPSVVRNRALTVASSRNVNGEFVVQSDESLPAYEFKTVLPQSGRLLYCVVSGFLDIHFSLVALTDSSSSSYCSFA